MDLRSQKVLPGWREAIIINDIEAGDEIIDVFGEGFSSYWEGLPTVTQTIYNVDSMSLKSEFSEQIEVILAKYQRSAPMNYIVITKSTNVNRVLEAVSALLVSFDKGHDNHLSIAGQSNRNAVNNEAMDLHKPGPCGLAIFLELYRDKNNR